MTRVLIVDDDLQLLRALRINLGARGYDVVTAADGRTGVQAAADRRPDVIVLDLGLPDLDGAEVITELRRFTATPVIVLSARTDSRDKVRALDRGADDYVTKPFGVDELMARLRAAVRRANAADADPAPVEAGALTIDLAARIVQREGAGRAPHADRVGHPRAAGAPARAAGRAAPAPPTRVGDVRAGRTPATCGCTSPSCGASWNATRPTRST